MSEPDPVVVCVRGIVRPDAGTLDTLAMLQLAALRLGLRVELDGVRPQLCELLELSGLAEVLGVEPGRETEQREQPLGLEVEDDPSDAAP